MLALKPTRSRYLEAEPVNSFGRRILLHFSRPITIFSNYSLVRGISGFGPRSERLTPATFVTRFFDRHPGWIFQPVRTVITQTSAPFFQVINSNEKQIFKMSRRSPFGDTRYIFSVLIPDRPAIGDERSE